MNISLLELTQELLLMFLARTLGRVVLADLQGLDGGDGGKRSRVPENTLNLMNQMFFCTWVKQLEVPAGMVSGTTHGEGFQRGIPNHEIIFNRIKR